MPTDVGGSPGSSGSGERLVETTQTNRFTKDEYDQSTGGRSADIRTKNCHC